MVSDRELLAAIQNKLDTRGPTFAFAIKAMVRQYMPQGSSDDAGKIPQEKRAAFLERLGSL
jgi:hypothetical protein